MHSLVKDKTMSKNLCNEEAIHFKIQFLIIFIYKNELVNDFISGKGHVIASFVIIQFLHKLMKTTVQIFKKFQLKTYYLYYNTPPHPISPPIK